MLIYYLSIYSIYLLAMVYSMTTYPGGFSFSKTFISFLGGSYTNPDGYIIHNIGMIFTGFASLPMFVYVYKKTKPTMKYMSLFGCFLGLLGLLGFAAVGIWYEGASFLGHKWATIFAFGGIGFSGLILFPVLIRRAYLKLDWPNVKHLIFMYGVIFLTLLYALEFQTLVSMDSFLAWNMDPTDSIWEWFFFGVASFYLIEIVAITK